MISTVFMPDTMALMDARYTAFSSVMSDLTLPYVSGLDVMSSTAVEGSSMNPLIFSYTSVLPSKQDAKSFTSLDRMMRSIMAATDPPAPSERYMCDTAEVPPPTVSTTVSNPPWATASLA